MGAADGGMSLSREQAEDLLYREALALDRREWDAWLAMYAEDVEYWMPAWRDETEPTADPDSELSLIWYRGRHHLEERVWRARSGTSVASSPLPRVVHLVTNVLVERSDEAEADVAASFAVHLHDVRGSRTHVFFGRYEYLLRAGGEGWLIARKKILLLNDTIPTVVDFYSI
jgi:benzoate/toluate 1,2-dioxygenase subunit beta